MTFLPNTKDYSKLLRRRMNAYREDGINSYPRYVPTIRIDTFDFSFRHKYGTMRRDKIMERSAV